MAKPPFNSSLLKLNRARDHIRDFDDRIKAFIEEKPYESVIEDDPDPAYEIHKFRLTRPIPPCFPLIMGDAVTNLRAALDHMAYWCALADGRIKPVPGNCDFPIGRSEGNYRGGLEGREAIPLPIRNLFAAFKPYKGGNPLLWRLHELSNRDKHCLLLLAPFALGRIMVNVHGVDPEWITAPSWDRSKDEFILFRCKKSLNNDPDIKIDIVLNAPDAGMPQPIVEDLYQMAGIVEGIIGTVEAECRRIGLIS